MRLLNGRKMEAFTRKQAVKMSGLTERQVQFYTDNRIIIPEVAESSGTGKKRLYSRHNILQMHVIKVLADQGVTIDRVRVILKYIENEGTIRQYEKGQLHDQNLKMHIKIIKKDDGRLEARCEMQPGGDCAVHMKEAEGSDMILLLNFGRIAGRSARS